MGINNCSECHNKQLIIDRLTEENQSLKQKLRYRERKQQEGFFGSSTPSSKIPVKANAPTKDGRKPKGAQRGHNGAGRKMFDISQADRIVKVQAAVDIQCSQCGGLLTDKGVDNRCVIESWSLRSERIIYQLPKKYCSRCNHTFQAKAPAVLPKSLYGNQLTSTAATMHYMHGIPMGRICEQINIGPGSLVEIFHRLATLFDAVPDRLIKEYRRSPAKHADETTWRTNGKNGYAWLFATDKLSIFQFRKTRSAEVPKVILGETRLPGVLVVDRYSGYNKAPCAIQYCYAHLLREVQDLEKEFPDSQEVKAFTSCLAPLLSLAMNLRSQLLSDTKFYSKAARLESQILEAIHSPANHLGIRRIQDIFRDNSNRLYHWARDRRVPADNNLAERDLRPTVIARKVSFGSQSDAGAHTRGVLMTVLHTLRKRQFDVAAHFKRVLDLLAKDTQQDPFPLLFTQRPQPP